MQTTIRSGWSGVRFGQPEVGASAERRRITRASDIIAFSDMTGDRNPLHYDDALSARTVFGRLIVQGGVTSGLLNALVAEDLPGPGSVFLASSGSSSRLSVSARRSSHARRCLACGKTSRSARCQPPSQTRQARFACPARQQPTLCRSISRHRLPGGSAFPCSPTRCLQRAERMFEELSGMVRCKPRSQLYEHLIRYLCNPDIHSVERHPQRSAARGSPGASRPRD